MRLTQDQPSESFFSQACKHIVTFQAWNMSRNRGLFCSGAVYQDVQLVWQNCRSFNEPDSDICKSCDEAQQAFLARWQQQGLPQPDCHPGADKKKKGGHTKAAAAEAEAAAARQSGKKPDGRQLQRDDDAMQRGKGAGVGEILNTAKRGDRNSASDKRKFDAQAEGAAAGKPSVKRKRGQDSDDIEVDPSSSAAAQPKKKSKGFLVKEDLAPEKMSAGARLRKGLPPTPSSRISPRMAAAEAAFIAAPVAADSAPKATVNPVGKSKTDALHQGAHKFKSESDPPVARRSSGRLK